MNVYFPFTARVLRCLAGGLLLLPVFPLSLILLLLAVTGISLEAGININGAAPLHPVPVGFGGTVLDAHRPHFATSAGGIDFKTRLEEANIKVVRNVSYPDYRRDEASEGIHTLSYFDTNMQALKDAGVQIPLLVLYTAPASALPYYNFNGTTGGAATVATNAAFLVNRYTSAPYNFPMLYIEVHNEPDLTVDYQYTNPQAYADAYVAVHNTLVTHGMRNRVRLCGPVMSKGYNEPFWVTNKTTLDNELSNRIFNTFMDQCGDIVDVVTYHTYSNDTDSAILNLQYLMENKVKHDRTLNLTDYASSSPTANRGLAALLHAMDNIYNLPSTVTTGITEHGTFSTNATAFGNALFNLAVSHFCLYDPRCEFTFSFIFDSYQGTDPLTFFESNGTPRKPYWAAWILGNYTGDTVLTKSVTGNANAAGNPNLLVSASRNSQYLFLQVLNRSSAAITDTVTITGLDLGTQAEIRTLSSSANPNAATSATLGSTFSRQFPAMSATVIRLPINSSSGGGSGNVIDFTGGFTAGSMQLNQNATISSGALKLINNGTLSRGSAYFPTKVANDAFSTSFDFSVSGPTSTRADGFTFTLQNAGLTALGGTGSSLGYVGITKSVALRFEFWGTSSVGQYSTNAAGQLNSVVHDLPSTLDLDNGQVFNVQAAYANPNLQVTLRNKTTNATDTRNYTVNIPGYLAGADGYAGFTAGSGASTSTISITDWTLGNGAEVDYSGGFTGSGMSLNSAAQYIGAHLQLTGAGAGQRGTAYASAKQAVNAFHSQFRFQVSSGSATPADGLTFVIQNSAATALGGTGSALGYVGIGNSVAVRFEFFGTPSTGVYVNGTLVTENALASGFDFDNGAVYEAELTYAAGSLQVILRNITAGASVTHNYSVNIPTSVGASTAWVGFTASTGGSYAVQRIHSWSFDAQ